MRTLFNDNWSFAELPLTDCDAMFKDGNPVIYNPDDYFDAAGGLAYKAVRLPHDWQIHHVKDLYKNSVGFYKKTFELDEGQLAGRHNAIRFEGVYMNSAVWVNGKKAGEWKYGYATFEFDISALVQSGRNEILVIAVYQNCNTRWYSGAGIFRDVTYINTADVYLPGDGVYFSAVPADCGRLDGSWNVRISAEAAGRISGHTIEHLLAARDGTVIAKSAAPLAPVPLGDEESGWLRKQLPSLGTAPLSRAQDELAAEHPSLWDTGSPSFYILTTRLLDKDGAVIDELSQHCGFKYARFDKDEGFFLNGRHVKINGACQHHDHGALGSAFDVNALRRQFSRLKEMGANSVRCSHNPPPSAWMDLCDEMGIMVDDEAFDMWEKPKTPFDYGNHFNDWWERDTTSWVRRDRNHPSLIMWSIGNEIYDTHVGNGYEITKKLYACVAKNDPCRNAPVTIASNYMMTEGAQHCAQEIDTVGYNYLERLYDEHHKKYPGWKIYGSETGSTLQTRGIYHFPESLRLVTFSDGQCSALENCTAPWGAASTQTIITNERDCAFSAGQYIWTGWDYIGEPTPYHTKSSFFGQIDTAGFPKDSFYMFKSEWAGKKTAPFVHLLPYWDWNEGQMIDVKAYTNADAVELFFNGTSLGRHTIDHQKDMEPFGHWVVEYHRGEIKAVAYDAAGKPVAEDVKRSFGDPARIVLRPETAAENGDTGNLHFIQIMTADKDGTLVENARNYITIKVSGDAELVGMDNGDSTDYDEYACADGKTLSRKLFANRLIAIVRARGKAASFELAAASKGLPGVSLRYDGARGTWGGCEPGAAIEAEYDFIPARKIELCAEGSTSLDAAHREIAVRARVLPANASLKKISWNPVLKECVASNNIAVAVGAQAADGSQSAAVRAEGDGECILRCTAKNGSELDQVISDLPFTVSGVGNPNVNPYELVEACRMSGWDDKDGKPKPELSLESGVSTRKSGPTWISFAKVDFGPDGADTIHIPVFSHETELSVEVWDGTPGTGTDYEGSKAPADGGGECLGKFMYKHESIYNVYSENVFVLSRRLFGVHTLSIVLPDGIYFHGFYFDKSPKAFAKLRALDADVVAGDSFVRSADAVEKIGNNVNLDFANMDFAADGSAKLTICGKSNTENNTINVKFFGADGSSSTQVIEFAHTDAYVEKAFPLACIRGMQKVSFVFLPGSNFDFRWFRFEK